jgi:hypothetical protein
MMALPFVESNDLANAQQRFAAPHPGNPGPARQWRSLVRLKALAVFSTVCGRRYRFSIPRSL